MKIKDLKECGRRILADLEKTYDADPSVDEKTRKGQIEWLLMVYEAGFLDGNKWAIDEMMKHMDMPPRQRLVIQ